MRKANILHAIILSPPERLHYGFLRALQILLNDPVLCALFFLNQKSLVSKIINKPSISLKNTLNTNSIWSDNCHSHFCESWGISEEKRHQQSCWIQMYCTTGTCSVSSLWKKKVHFSATVFFKSLNSVGFEIGTHSYCLKSPTSLSPLSYLFGIWKAGSQQVCKTVSCVGKGAGFAYYSTGHREGSQQRETMTVIKVEWKNKLSSKSEISAFFHT